MYDLFADSNDQNVWVSWSSSSTCWTGLIRTENENSARIALRDRISLLSCSSFCTTVEGLFKQLNMGANSSKEDNDAAGKQLIGRLPAVGEATRKTKTGPSALPPNSRPADPEDFSVIEVRSVPSVYSCRSTACTGSGRGSGKNGVCHCCKDDSSIFRPCLSNLSFKSSV